MVTFMIAILLDTPGYRIMALLHILSAIVAFGPLLLYSGLHKAGETTTIARLHMRLTFPALIALWVLGMGLAGMSEDNYKVADPWITEFLEKFAIEDILICVYLNEVRFTDAFIRRRLETPLGIERDPEDKMGADSPYVAPEEAEAEAEAEEAEG